jgi:hypothetical protein
MKVPSQLPDDNYLRVELISVNGNEKGVYFPPEEYDSTARRL